MSGKLIADLRRQVDDLHSYIHSLESSKELAEVTITIGDDRVSERAQYDGFEQLLSMAGDLLMRLGLERADYIALLDDEMKAQEAIWRVEKA